MKSAVEEIAEHATAIKEGRDPKVKPGAPERFTDAAAPGDTIRQGDLYITIREGAIPEGYVLVEKPKEVDRQMVPGNTEGAKHCLDSMDGVDLYRPAQWTEGSLDGPIINLEKERTVLHPTHGSVTIPKGMSAEFTYQREWSKERKRAIRAAD